MTSALLVGLVIVAGLLLLAAAAWLIWRIEQQGQENAARMTSLVDDVHASLRILKFGAEAMTRYAQSQLDTRKDTAAAEFNEKQLQQMALQIAQQVAPLLERVQAPPASGAADGESAGDRDAGELKRTLALKGRLEGELEALREQCNDQLRMLTEQRRDHQVALTALSNATALREANEQLLDELRAARGGLQAPPGDTASVMAELQLVREQLAALAAAPVAGPASLDDAMTASITEAIERIGRSHSPRIQELEAELTRASEASTRLMDELTRTLREKSFIEDQFMTLTEDAATETTATAAA